MNPNGIKNLDTIVVSDFSSFVGSLVAKNSLNLEVRSTLNRLYNPLICRCPPPSEPFSVQRTINCYRLNLSFDIEGLERILKTTLWLGMCFVWDYDFYNNHVSLENVNQLC